MRCFVVPGREFTFQELCDANPAVKPLTVLRFITEQITEGKLTKKNTVVEKGQRATYAPIQSASAQ